MSNIDRKACFQKQLLDMSNAVDALETDVENVYTKTEANEKFLDRGACTIETDNVDLNALYSTDVKSELSLEPTSAILRTMSGTDTSTIGISATEIDISTGILKYNGKKVATKDYIHQITLYNDNYASSNLHCFLTFNIRNNVSTPYTTTGQVYNALIAAYGENKFIGGSGYYQVLNGGYKEILYNISTRSNTDYILDAEYFEVADNADSGGETIYLTNFQAKDIIL